MTVETRGRLVQEEKQLRLRSELDTNRKQLSLLNIKTFARYTDDGIGKVAHVQHLDDFLDIVVLLFLANRLGLSEHRGELKRFAHSSCFEVKIPKMVSKVFCQD